MVRAHMVRALFAETRWPVGALGLAMAAIVPGLLLLLQADGHPLIACGLIGFGSVVLVIAIGSLYFTVTDFFERRRHSVTILDGRWTCYYRQRQLMVSVPMDIVSDASKARLECVAQLGEQVIPLTLAREFQESRFVRHRYVAEYSAANVEIPEGVTVARITFSIWLSDGVSRKMANDVSVL